jgi:hypothetical protein
MPLFVLRNTTRGGLTRFASNHRNGRSRIVAFEERQAAGSALDLIKEVPAYKGEVLLVWETEPACLAALCGDDVAVDYCSVSDGGDIEVSRAIILGEQGRFHVDVRVARMRLEREFQMTVDGDGEE